MFEKLRNKRRVLPPRPAKPQDTLQDLPPVDGLPGPGSNSKPPGYRAEITVEYKRNKYYEERTWHYTYKIIDSDGAVVKTESVSPFSAATTESAAFAIAKREAKDWIDEQILMDRGPVTKTVEL
jgi:hypothetical protein